MHLYFRLFLAALALLTAVLTYDKENVKCNNNKNQPYYKSIKNLKKYFQTVWQGWNKAGRVTLFSLWYSSEVTRQKHKQMHEQLYKSNALNLYLDQKTGIRLTKFSKFPSDVMI